MPSLIARFIALKHFFENANCPIIIFKKFLQQVLFVVAPGAAGMVDFAFSHNF